MIDWWEKWLDADCLDRNKKVEKLPFIKDIVVFSMQFGYRFSDYSFKLRKEKKPKINEVINWV